MYITPLVVYKIIEPHNYLLLLLDGKILRGLFEHKRLKPATIKASQGDVLNLPQLKQVMNIGIMIQVQLIKKLCYSFRILILRILMQSVIQNKALFKKK